MGQVRACITKPVLQATADWGSLLMSHLAVLAAPSQTPSTLRCSRRIADCRRFFR